MSVDKMNEIKNEIKNTLINSLNINIENDEFDIIIKDIDLDIVPKKSESLNCGNSCATSCNIVCVGCSGSCVDTCTSLCSGTCSSCSGSTTVPKLKPSTIYNI